METKDNIITMIQGSYTPRNTLTRQRSVYPSTKQKRKLIAFVAQHPQLISFKRSQGFSHSDSQTLWNNIAEECNLLPGAKKTWRQWRKTWQDIRSNVKRKQQGRMGEIPETIAELTDTEKEALGLKNVSSTTNYQDTMEFVAPEDESTRENPLNDYNDSASIDESESPPEVKVEVTHLKAKSHSDDCVFNCNKLAVLEQSKIQIKEDYFNFKKDYLRQKLILMKEQTEALKCIAQGLAK